MHAVSRDKRLSVAFDATPLLGTRTGVGAFCAGALSSLGAMENLDVAAFAVSWRRRGGIVAHLPKGVEALDRPIPARPVHLSWRWLSRPPIEWWTGAVDVVHGTNFVVPPTRKAGRVVTVHDLTTVRFPQLCDAATRVFPTLVRNAIRQGAWVHTPSEFVAGEVVEILGADPARVRAVHHGVPAAEEPSALSAPDDRLSAPEPITLSLPDGPFALPEGRFILTLGTIEPRKDHPGLVKAFDMVAGSHPDVTLVVAGPGGWGVDALNDAVESSPFKERILRLGYVSPGDRTRLMRRARVFAYPSVYEGFGLPPLEAMIAGVPVVATAAGAVPEIAGDGALLVPVGDATAFAEALSSAIDDDRRREELVERGRMRVRSFTWEKCAAGLAELYESARGRS